MRRPQRDDEPIDLGHGVVIRPWPGGILLTTGGPGSLVLNAAQMSVLVAFVIKNLPRAGQREIVSYLQEGLKK